MQCTAAKAISFTRKGTSCDPKHFFSHQVASEDAAAIKRLEADVKAAQKDLEPISRKLAPLQAKLGALEACIEDAGGPPLKKQREKVAQLQQVGRVPSLWFKFVSASSISIMLHIMHFTSCAHLPFSD
jgi:hypothetical protein